MMNKILIIIFALFAVNLFVLSAPIKTQAVDIFPTCNSSNPSSVCRSIHKTPKHDPVITVIKSAMELISFVGGAAAVILIIVSAIRFIISSGNPESVASARSTLVYALIGIIVIILAQSIIAFVLNKTG